MSEYQELSVRELLVKAMDVREDSGPLLEEAERRDRSAIQELAAIGRQLDAAWQIVGSPFLVAGEAEFAVCARLRSAESRG